MDNLATDLVEWQPSEDALQECQQRNIHEKFCENYITILSFDESAKSNDTSGNRLLTCGTYASRPQCTWRTANALSDVLDTFDGIGKSPQSPDLSSTYVRLTNGDHYFATSIDYTELGIKLDYLIDRSLGPSRQLRTDRYNSNWMNGIIYIVDLTYLNRSQIDDLFVFCLRACFCCIDNYG